MKLWRQISLAIAVIVLVIATHWSVVEDLFNLVPEPPSAQIERLAVATTMTRSAQRLFYRQNPIIEVRETFRAKCEASGHSIVLGCYNVRGGVGQIVIQKVTDPRLQGLMEVTAAHEMLHAAYLRLRESERSQLTPRLKTAAQRVTNKRLNNVLEEYRAKDTELYVNELHSHLGTELATLGDGYLDKYYQRYFGDRQRVVAFAQESGRVLGQLEEQAERLKPEIEQLEKELDASKQGLQQAERELENSSQILNRMKTDLEAMQRSIEATLSQGSQEGDRLIAKFEQQKAQFNQQVVQHNRQVEAQNEQVDRFNEKVKVYRQKVSDYNQVAREGRALLDSLKSEPQATPK